MKNTQLKIGFNLIGKFYNPIKRLVLGNTPEQVIAYAVSKIKPSGNVLVIGGGGDNTSLELLKLENVKSVTLIDISSVLLDVASQRLRLHARYADAQLEKVSFLDFQTSSKFDCIISPFYLDLFADQEILDNIKRFNELLNVNGKILVIDFSNNQDSSKKGRIIIAFLYAVFFIITRSFRFRIPLYKPLFLSVGFELSYKEFIKGTYQILSFRRKSELEL